MAIFLDQTSRVVVQGMTGSEGSKHTRRMLAAGTTVVGGTNPKKAGTSVDFDGTALPVFATIADALGVDKVRVLSAQEDARAAEREQWDDANNFLAVAPGIVLGYERNTVTNGMLTDNGIDVVSIPGSELGRGRGGSRCMTCPIQRDGI